MASSNNLTKPSTKYFILEVYDWENPTCRQNQQILQKLPSLDSLLQEMPVYSLTQMGSKALWRLYVKDEKFPWPQGWAPPGLKGNDLVQWSVFPNTTYLLVNNRFRIVGAYPDLNKLAQGLYWRKTYR